MIFYDLPDNTWVDTTEAIWADYDPATYTELVASISRQPVELVIITAIHCSLVYGSTPCTASGVAGEECYNTWRTCQDLVNYAPVEVDLKFSSIDAAQVSTARPYVQSISTIPTKLTSKITEKARVKIKMVDETSDDIGIDPYVSTRSSVQGTYFKKFIARNPNFIGWSVKVYQGFTGLDEREFMQRFAGKLENITGGRGVFTLNVADLLTTIDGVSIPGKIESKLLNDITDAATTIVLTSILLDDDSEMAASGYMQVDDEIISYTSITTAANQLNGCVRGEFNTAAILHKKDARIAIVKYYEPDNPFDILHTIWNESGGDTSLDFDATSWAYWRDWPKVDIDFSAIILEEDDIEAADLFWELADILDINIWQNEEQKITVRRSLSNEPGREYNYITDDANIIDNSSATNYNEKSRKSRVTMYWGKTATGGLDSLASYTDVSVVIDSNAESTAGYNDIQEDTLLNRWISKRFLQEEVADRYAASLIRRRLFNKRDAQPIVKLSVDMKDEGFLTGDNVVLQSDETLNVDGTPVSKNYYIISRQKRAGKLQLELKELPRRRVCFVAPTGTPDYSNATDAQREYGFISNNNGDMPDGSPAYFIY